MVPISTLLTPLTLSSSLTQPLSAPRHCGRKQDVGRERRGEKPAVRGPMGTANGERGRRRARRGGGRGRGAISAGAARRSLSAAEQSGAARRQREQAGGPAGARRSAGGRGNSKGGQRRRALGPGCGSRRPRRRLLQEEPRGHRPCPRPASGHRCSPGAPRGLACVKVNDGWGRPGASDRACRARPQARRLCGLLAPSGARSRAGFGVTPPAYLLRAAPPCALATSEARLEAPGCAGAALVPPGSLPALRGGLWCLGPRGWGGEGSGVTRLLLPPLPPPPPAPPSSGVLSAARTPSHSCAAQGRAADRPERRWEGGCFLIPLGAGLLDDRWCRVYGLFKDLQGIQACVLRAEDGGPCHSEA